MPIPFVLGACVHLKPIDELSDAYKRRLARHPYWLSVAVLENDDGEFPPSDVAAVKKWEVAEESGVAFAMKPGFTSSFVGFVQAIRGGDDPFTEISLDDDLDPNAFLPLRGMADELPIGKSPQRYRLEDIDGKRFQIIISDGRGRIVFMPAPNDYAQSPAAPKHEIGIWTTPFGPEGELLQHLARALKEDGRRELPTWPDARFLHHDRGARRRVAIANDLSVPTRFRPLAKSVAKKWNKAVGWELFAATGSPKALDHGDCLTGFTVCVKWSGEDAVPMTGLSAYTELGFDPQSGLITGAVVTIVSDVKAANLGEIPARLRQKFEIGSMSVDAAAEAMTRHADFERYAHPFAALYVEYLLMHEMGHVNGLAHNFFADPATTAERPASTIMTYVPYPLAHAATDVGALDLERFEILYRQKDPTAKLTFCSTLDALSPRREGNFARRSPRCDLFTVGNQADWYMRIARLGRYGVFTEYPDMSHVPDSLRRTLRDINERKQLPPLNVLTQIGYLLNEESPASDQSPLRAFLCSQKAELLAIEAQLRTHQGIELRCPPNRR